MTQSHHPSGRVIARMQANWVEVAHPATFVSIAVQRLARLLEQNAAAALSPVGLSLTEFELLSALRSHPAPHQLTPTELYDAILISTGGLTKVLKGLAERDLVERPAGAADRRSKPIRLTERGRALVEDAMRRVQRADAPIFASQAPEAASALNEMLAGLVREAEGARS